MQIDRRYLQKTDNFVAEDLKQMQQALRYNEWLFSLVRPYLGRRLFEVGAGTGNMTKQLLQYVEYAVGIEPNPACLQELERALCGHPHFEYRPWQIEQCDVEWLLQKQFDTVLCVNVLEHIEDDIQALKFFKSVLYNRDGRVVLLVPAVPWAYGPIDAAVGHFRRYSRKSMSQALHQAGLKVEALRYSNFLGLLGWLFNAYVKRNTKQSDAQIRIFDRLVVPWYSRLEKMIAPSIGMSLVAVATKGE
jgi:SAM-dependent methyltransferase